MKQNFGSPYPLGIEFLEESVNFALFAPNATNPILCIYQGVIYSEFQMCGPTDGIWHLELSNIPEGALYLYRIGGVLLSDPYAKAVSSFAQWGDFKASKTPLFCHIQKKSLFDWQGVRSPQIPIKDLVIYELHVRGFTIHPSSAARFPGTYLGVIEKIPYLKRLGVNAVELMPIFEFDETHCKRTNPKTGEALLNYWGYDPIHFFLPMSRYASDSEKAELEFKTMVRELHREGIEVILDVVYNHTGEDIAYMTSFRGIDRTAYYMLNDLGEDKNYTGCGNTFLANGRGGMTVILESLRYWAGEMRVDGFRFDLASVLTRGIDGKPLSNPPVLREIEKDSLLSKKKLIAEAWDAGGLYQLGQFSQWGRWSSWNGRFRDHVRKFIKGTDSEAGAFATAICGSEPTYYSSDTPLSSINFFAAHDGYTLRDLVTYERKYNEENGENNLDGSNANYSWNCGFEGPSNLSHEVLRERQMRNFWLALFLSQGVPLYLMGDEIGHTRRGNNNPYNQDNEVNWLDWKLVEKNEKMIDFVSSLTVFRSKRNVLRREAFLTDRDVCWHGRKPFQPDWSESSRLVAFSFVDEQPIYIAFNANNYSILLELPQNNAKQWREIFMSANDWDQHYFKQPERAPILGESVELPPYSALVALTVWDC